MIIALPATDHDHLADALVRDLGFTRAHVDDGVRALLVELDPIVSDGVTMANQGFSPRLKSKLEQYGGWDRLLNPPRPGSQPDRVAAEVKRLLDVLRRQLPGATAYEVGDVVVVGSSEPTVAIEGRFGEFGARLAVEHWIEPAGVIGEQAAIVAYVQQCRTPRPVQVVHEFTPGEHTMSIPGVTPTVEQFEEALRKPLDEPMFDEPADDALAATLRIVENAHENRPE